MDRSRANTRVMAGTPRPMASSSGPWAKTSSGGPEKGMVPLRITTSRPASRATSSMEWDTRITQAFFSSW